MPRKLFISYSHEDIDLRKQLETHLAYLDRSGKIERWSDGQLLPGSDWENVLDAKLQEADVILFLVTPAFFASDYCWEKERPIALQRRSLGECHVIPVIAEPSGWTETEIAQLQCVPGSSKPVTSWEAPAQAWTDVCFGIQSILNEPPSKGSSPDEALIPFRQISHDLRDSLKNANSVSLLTRTGLGWFRDYSDILSNLLPKRRSRVLVLNPDASAELSWNSAGQGWSDDPEQTPDEYRQAARKQLKEFSDLGTSVRVLDALIPVTLLITERDKGSPETIYVQYPKCREPFQGPPIFKVDREDEASFEYYRTAFETIWNKYGSPRI